MTQMPQEIHINIRAKMAGDDIAPSPTKEQKGPSIAPFHSTIQALSLEALPCPPLIHPKKRGDTS